jgi:hypothetical protein
MFALIDSQGLIFPAAAQRRLKIGRGQAKRGVYVALHHEPARRSKSVIETDKMPR